MNYPPIDIVVTWVDGDDPVWQNKKAKYTGVKISDGNTAARYRDLGTLKYWFRGIEKFAPWVRYVYFVTDDQKPAWLNLDHPKLKWVKHTDYIPEQYLPTFNSHVIEWNLHRIDGLSENFIYFNDDVFLIKKTNPSDFFVDGKPCVLPLLSRLHPNDLFNYMLFNNAYMINRHFSFRECVRRDIKKWLKHQSLSGLMRLVLFGMHSDFPGFANSHIGQCFKKSTIQTLWECEYEWIDATCRNKIRTKDDLTPWSVTNWQIMTGDFHPQKPIGKYFTLQKGHAIDYVRKQRGKVICINDTDAEQDFENHKQMLVEAFETVFFEKSSFEL